MSLSYQEYYTFDDYQQWSGDWELIEGMPYAMAHHQQLLSKLSVLILPQRLKRR